jgi:predicted nucleic acid-binding protein
MILIDTNVISEIMRVQPHETAASWVDAQPADSLFLCTPVLAELRYGIERLADGRKKRELLTAVGRIEHELYAGRILTFDQPAAAQYLAAARERQGRRMNQMDALIASIAAAHGASLATRDIDDFTDLKLKLINPFEAPAAR